MEIKSDRDNLFSPQITDDLKDSINSLLDQYEVDHNIHIFFACDTGSRSLSVAVDTSDFDLNAFFIPHYKEYLKVIRKSPLIISKQGLKFTSKSQHIFEIDIVLWDVKDWLKEKTETNNLGCDFWFDSPIIYRNRHPEIISQIRNMLEPPAYYFKGKFKNNYDMCVKDIKKSGTQNKKIMNTLIYSIQYLHVKLFNEFPLYNIFLEIKKFEELKEKIIKENLLTEEEYVNLSKCFNFIEVCYEEKKKGRKSLTDTIPDFVKFFVEMLDNKFNQKANNNNNNNYSLSENLWNIQNAQKVFNQILDLYKNNPCNSCNSCDL